MNEHLKITQDMLDLIKKWEGLELKAYKDAVGIWTIGYGTTASAGVGITPRAGMTITEKQAEEYLRRYLEKRMPQTLGWIKVPTTQNQFNAIMSFIYNVGIGAFQNSTLLRKHNAKDFKGASLEFQRWNKAKGRVLKGLVNRRKDEMDMYINGMTVQAPEPVKTETKAPSEFFGNLIKAFKGE